MRPNWISRFFVQKFLKFPKIYFYFRVIIIFGDLFDATPIVQGPMGQFILLCSRTPPF